MKTIVHIPHSSTHIPDRIRSQFVLRASALQQEINLLTDWFTTAVNHPFAGAMVARGFYQTDKRVVALMIEVRRDLYMDERNAEKLTVFDTVRRRIRNVISEIIDLN